MMRLRGFLRREFSFIGGNYLILVVSWIIMDIGWEMPAPYFQQYVDALGGNVFPLALGIIGFANFFVMALVAVPGGFLADKFGRRWLIRTMTFGIALSFLFFVLAPFWSFTAAWHLILVGTIVQSFCLIYQPALFAMVQDSLPPGRRGVGSSLIEMIHGTFNTPGPAIGGLLVLSFGLIAGMQSVYLVLTGLFFAAAVWRTRLTEIVACEEKIRFRYFISSYPQAIKESLGVWKLVPRSVFWLLLVEVLAMFATALTNVINALYARDVLGIPQDQWFLVYIPMLITLVLASYPIGKLVDKVGMRLPLALGPCTLVASLLLFINGNLFTVMGSLALMGLTNMLIMSSGMALSACLVEPHNRGKIRGGLNFIGYLFTGVGMLLGNFLYVLTPQLPFYLTMAIAIPMIVVVILRIPEPTEEERRF
jgi:MFS family permease